MPDNRTDHPTLRQVLLAFRRDYAEAVGVDAEGNPPPALPEIQADLLCRIWGEAPDPTQPIDAQTNLDIMLDFNDKSQVQKVSITMKPSGFTVAVVAEAAQEKIATMQAEFMKKAVAAAEASNSAGDSDNA